MANHWFKVHTNILNSEKVQKLPAKLFKDWINVLAVATAFDGIVPGNRELAFRLRISQKRAQALIEKLLKRSLIDLNSDGILSIHRWNEHQTVRKLTESRPNEVESDEKRKKTDSNQRTYHENAKSGQIPRVDKTRQEKRIVDDEADAEWLNRDLAAEETESLESTPPPATPPRPKHDIELTEAELEQKYGDGWRSVIQQRDFEAARKDRAAYEQAKKPA